MHLGNYPTVSLADARLKFNEASALLGRGVDPQLPPPPPETAPEILTVNALAEEWIIWSQKNHSVKWSNTLKLALQKDILPIHGQKLASEIRKKDAIKMLEEKAGTAPGQARNLHKALRGMWEYATENEMLDFNPFAEIKVARSIPSMGSVVRERILDDNEIIYLWTAIDQGGGSESVKRALKLILATGQRPGEVAGMSWEEIEIGEGKPICQTCRRCGWWTIPKSRLKSKKSQGVTDHRVYLSSLSMSLINASPVELSNFICPSDVFEEVSHVAVNSINHHVRRSVEGTGKTPYYGLPQWQPHDLRRTAATGMGRVGASEIEVERILGHLPPVLVRTYNKFKYDNIKLQWLTAWGEYIQQLVDKLP